jgi:hypothetical protein
MRIRLPEANATRYSPVSDWIMEGEEETRSATTVSCESSKGNLSAFTGVDEKRSRAKTKAIDIAKTHFLPLIFRWDMENNFKLPIY